MQGGSQKQMNAGRRQTKKKETNLKKYTNLKNKPKKIIAMGKVKYHDIVEQLTGALDSKKYSESHGMRLVSRHRKGSGEEHQIYFMQKHEGAWSEGATRNRELIKAAQKRAHAIEKAARKPEECSPEAVAEAREWQERFQAYRAGLKEGEKGYGSLYTYVYVQMYREIKVES